MPKRPFTISILCQNVKMMYLLPNEMDGYVKHSNVYTKYTE